MKKTFFSSSLVLLSLVVLTVLTLWLVNLKIIFKAEIIKIKLREFGVYENLAVNLRSLWLEKYMQETKFNILEYQDINNKLEYSLTDDWLIEEIERNFDEVKNFIDSQGKQLSLYVNLLPVKKRLIASFKNDNDLEKKQALENNFPEKFDLFLDNNIVDKKSLEWLYQAKTSVRLINLSIKILFFALGLTLLTLFFISEAKRFLELIGWGLSLSGLVSWGMAFFSQGYFTDNVKNLINKLFLTENFSQALINLLTFFARSYFNLIYYQSIGLVFIGLLALLVSLLIRQKKS